MSLTRNPDPEYPSRRGAAASRAAPERTASPHQPPGPRSPSLGPEKRRGNFGRNFANFALGEGEAARMAGPAAGRDARGGPPARPGHPERAGPPKEPLQAGRPAPRSPTPPLLLPDLVRALGSPSSRDAQRPELTGSGNLALSASDVIFFLPLQDHPFPPDSSSFTPSPSFVCLYPSVFPTLYIFDF